MSDYPDFGTPAVKNIPSHHDVVGRGPLDFSPRLSYFLLASRAVHGVGLLAEEASPSSHTVLCLPGAVAAWLPASFSSIEEPEVLSLHWNFLPHHRRPGILKSFARKPTFTGTT